MTEQLEKVCKGLECCLHNDHKNCHYNRDDVKDTVCTTEMMSDALALIRQQQERIAALEAAQTARVMNENEIKSISGYIWKEYKGMHAMTVVLIEHGMDRVPFDGDFPTNELNWSLYNKAWRCWTQRPTDEQRKAVKWE